MKLTIFNELDFLPALKAFFAELQVPINAVTDRPIPARDILMKTYRDVESFRLMDDVYFLGMVNDGAFRGESGLDLAATQNLEQDYDGVVIFGVTLHDRANGLLPTRSQLAEISRAFNREFCYTPVVVVFRYGDGVRQYLAFANTERSQYKQQWRQGEKAGKVTLLRDVSISNIHAAHEKIIFGDKNLNGLKIDTKKINSFKKLYDYWQKAFSLQALNDQFYADLQDWFYYASQHIKLPFKPEYIPEKENIKNFLVRLLARTMFCWFIKEKGLIKPEILELRDWDGEVYPLTVDCGDDGFLESNSYYRGVLQNVFFNSLNQKDKKSLKDFKWTKYLHSDFKLEWFTAIPYLNGGIFDKLDEDNAKESIEDSVMGVPNFLFYGIETEEIVTKGKKTEAVRLRRKGLNEIFKSYKFTLEENTPYEEDIALDPELLGLVFENLLAELDPNLEESTLKSIRKQTGSYYTPRKVIQEMVNESLFLYLKKHTQPESLETLKKLVYENILEDGTDDFCDRIVNGIDRFKVLDPACGSGAFPMGVLHRLVDILKLVDSDNSKWLRLKLQPVDPNYRDEFEKMLKQHLDDYSRKLGIIRDSIYGIDIQPLAVQITKLRFFISLLIDQKVEKGITPMPNIETKIICANSLKNIQPDLLSYDAIPKLKIARLKYYKPDLSNEEKQAVTEEIVTVLDAAFPSFSTEIMGRHIAGQNKELLRHWFTHATVAAPFFNLDFFYPELENQGFDCVIGNPPYGGTKISDDVRKNLGIDSKDPYGAFIARFLASNNKQTPLKDGGVLAYIVSDTFMTIKSHHALRRQMMDNYIHKMIRVHPDTFNATVNTAIIICERNTSKVFNQAHVCQMVDMTNVSIHDNYSHFVELLREAKGVDFGEVKQGVSNQEYGIYYYPQCLIRTNSNLPFFVASPKLFALMNNKTRQTVVSLNENQVNIYSMVDIIDDVCSGVKTYNNKKYIKSINGTQGYEEIKQIEIYDGDYHKDLMIGLKGKQSYIMFEKGGESIDENGDLSHIYKPSDFYINWTKETIDEINSASGLRNKTRYFEEGISFSESGVYSPVFRYFSGCLFANSCPVIFLKNKEYVFYILAILVSTLIRYILKNYLNHTVHTLLEDIRDIPISNTIFEQEKLSIIISNAIEKLKNEPSADRSLFISEIDKLVYEAYGLNAEDIEEVENWYARRYPKLSKAQKANLRQLGKSDDYLQLYGER